MRTMTEGLMSAPLSLAHQVMTPIAAHLDGDDLSALARTCRDVSPLRRPSRTHLVARRVRRLLGKTHCAVHLRAWSGTGI